MKEMILISVVTVAATVMMLLISTSVYGSNESSWKFGFNLAINNLTNQIVAPWDGDEDSPSLSWNVSWPSHFFMNPDICNLDSSDNGCPSMGDVQAVYCTTGQPDHPQVTNSTSCLDGY